MSSMMPMGGGTASHFDVERFVNEVIDGFLRQSFLPLAQEARAAVVEPARQHRAEIEQDVQGGRARPEEIEDAVRTVLEHALDFARKEDRGSIEEANVRQAMRLECRYFGWC